MPRPHFLTRVSVTAGGCWEWTGALTRGGYARSDGQYLHRRAYIELVGPIPDGLQLDHLCRNRACVNPEHLEPVTGQENTRRGEVGRVQRERTHCPRLHPYNDANTYLTPDGRRDCRECRRAARLRYYHRTKGGAAA